MEIRRPIVSLFIKGILNLLCKVDTTEVVKTISENEPLLIIFNHVNFLEVPLLVTNSYPLYITGLAKSETWKNPFFAFIFNTYKAIPIDRRKSYSESFKHACDAIKNGFFVCISPEGTRSKNGVLQKGKAGLVQLALEAGVPILPVVHHGGEKIWNNLKRFKRTPFYFKAGLPFRIKFEGRPDRDERELIITEVMIQMAKLLPEEMRGIYSELVNLECKYLDFIK
jgi:1-acyl-sn-glycerol-3-phosphate acyltransferase